MSEDIIGEFVAVIICIFALLGLILSVATLNSFVLNEGKWLCTESAIVNGKAECIKYEVKK
jgi:hypothetical protein